MLRIIIRYLLLFLTFHSFATPIVEKVQSFYPIKGETAQDLRNQMDELGPSLKEDHFDAQTTWYITWKYNWQAPNSSQDPCKLTDVQVLVSINILFPQWTNQNSGSSPLQAKWSKYLTALEKHEQEHENNGMEAAQEIEAALLGITSMPSCPELQTKVDSTAKSILKQHHIWDKQFDIDTNHGKKDGAVFP